MPNILPTISLKYSDQTTTRLHHYKTFKLDPILVLKSWTINTRQRFNLLSQLASECPGLQTPNYQLSTLN
jgi:hypothetical protein